MHFLLFLHFCIIFKLSNSSVCKHKHSVDISSATYDELSNTYTFEEIVFPEGTFFKDENSTRGCVCDVRTCVNLCCPDGQANIDNVCRDYNWTLEINYLDNSTDEDFELYSVVLHHECVGVILDPDSGDSFELLKDGRLFSYGIYFPFNDYCISRFSDGVGAAQAHTCIHHFAEERQNPVFSYGLLISIVFFLITLGVLYLIQDARNINRISHMCYIISITLAYITLLLIQLIHFAPPSCDVLATLCLYFFMSTFWSMNFFCKEIYSTVSGHGEHAKGFIKVSDRYKKFSYYCVHAYVFPLIQVIFVHGMNALPDTSVWYHPDFATNQCWFGDELPVLLYFYGVVGLILLSNIILFIMSVIKIRHLNIQSAEDLHSKKKYKETKARIELYFKLLVIFGINWSLEFISALTDWLLGSKKIINFWYFADLVNSLFGIFVFYIFVCNKRTWLLLRRRYYIITGQTDKVSDLSQRSLYHPMVQIGETFRHEEETLME